MLLAVTPALAADTATFGMRVIAVGDGMGKLRDVAGEPDRIVQLENKYGAGVAERYEYYRSGKTISVTVANGQVIRISEVR